MSARSQGRSAGPQVLVSVLMPVRNGGALLQTAVQSIRLQTLEQWELLILDDGSDDGALADLAALQDGRIRILRSTQRLGIAARLNQGVAMAHGRFVARMDADDVSFPERLMRQVEMLQADAGLDLLGVSVVTIDGLGHLTGVFPQALTHAQICARPWRGFHLAHPGWMGRIEWFRANAYAEPGPHGCEDQDLLLRSYRRSRFACTQQVLLAYRLRETTDWAGLRRTRLAWWQCQQTYFRRANQRHYLVLAGIGYAVRRLRDAWLRCRGRSLFRVGKVGADVQRRWTELCARLR